MTSLNCIAALWVFIGRSEGLNNSWMKDTEAGALHGNRDAINLFILSDYFIVNTVTTVGYGDASATNFPERMFMMVFEV